jgi:dTDP-4-amino-4,6-dideoxygalactose transaminase
MHVPFFPYPRVFTDHEQELTNIFKDIGSRGAFIMQRDLETFETQVAKTVGAPFAVGVGNATDGLEMLLQLSGAGQGDEVLFCSHTMVATASAIVSVGATPIPVEADRFGRMDPEATRKAITRKTKVIMPTQLNGTTCDMDALVALADDNNLKIVEDSAQGLGSTFKGRHAGTFGLGGCISFYPAKNLGCLGDGGVVFLQDEGARNQFLRMRDHGRDPLTGDVVLWGRNSRLDNLQAAFLNYLLERYPETVSRRREVAALYESLLSGLDQVQRPPAPDADSSRFDVFQNYEVRCERRDELRSYLSSQGVGTLVQWGGKAVHQFESLGFTQELPATDRLMSEILLLPISQYVSDQEVRYVAASIRSFYSGV